MKKATIGIDPGSPTGIGVIIDGGEYYAYYTKECSIGETIRSEHACLKSEGYIVCVYLESVHSFPGQGVASSFKFGKSFGEAIGALDAIQASWATVTPQKWQKTISGIPKKKDGPTAHKRALKIEAQRRFPDAKLTLKSCDALLIAEWGHKDRVI